VKRLLVIANLFHAAPRISGLAACLPEFGWEATIVTPPLGEDETERLGLPDEFCQRARLAPAPYRGDVYWYWRRLFQRLGLQAGESVTEQLNRSLNLTGSRTLVHRLRVLYESVVAFPDAELGWHTPALRAASGLLTSQPYDAMLSSSPYPTSHVVAARLKQRFGLKWVADFRDPWTQNHSYPYGFLRKRLDGWLERRVLAQADAVTAAAPAYAEKQRRFLRRPVSVITNGFDPEALEGPPAALTHQFTITYTGSIYIGQEDPV